MKSIKGLVKKVEGEYEEIILKEENRLEEMQKIVEGYIEGVCVRALDERNITLTINEEGKLINLKPSYMMIDENDEIIDIIVGNCIFLGYDSETGEDVSLTDKQIKFIKKEYELNSFILNRGELVDKIGLIHI